MPADPTIQQFSAVCDNCGPSFFAFNFGQDKDHDPVWCTHCKIPMTFQQAETRWHQADEPRQSSEPDPETNADNSQSTCFAA